MTEIWKDIKSFEGLYQVSNLGNIKSYYTKKILKPYINIYGYCRVSLYKNYKCKNCAVHRLVAEAFIPNPNKLKTINHIDKNKLNNCVDNLEWATIKDNVIYSQAKKVNQYDKNGNFIKQWISIIEAGRVLNISNANIIKCCKNDRKTAGGYIWKYSN